MHDRQANAQCITICSLGFKEIIFKSFDGPKLKVRDRGEDVGKGFSFSTFWQC